MQVNFTGFKNTTYATLMLPNHKNVALPNDVIHSFNTQLVDDLNGKDLTEFKKIIQKTNQPKHPINKNMISIELCEWQEGNRKVENNLFVNNNIVEINDKNLPIISYVAKLLKKSVHTPVDEFKIDTDYINGNEISQSISLGFDMKKMNNKDCYNSFIYAALNPESIKEGANKLFNYIQNEMVNYFK